MSDWSDAEVAWVRNHIRSYNPWLEGEWERVADALFLAGIGGLDVPTVLGGRNKRAAFRRELFSAVFGRDCPANTRERERLLKDAPFPPGPKVREGLVADAAEAERLARFREEMAERDRAIDERARVQEADPEFQARRNANQARLRRIEDFNAALNAAPWEVVLLRTALNRAKREPLVACPFKAPRDAGLLQPRHRGVYIGTSAYAIGAAGRVRVIPAAVFAREFEKFKDVWTEAMQAAATATAEAT